MSGNKTVFEGMEQLKQEHPVIAEALELFGITANVYQEALEAMQPKLIYTSASTTAITPITHITNSTRAKGTSLHNSAMKPCRGKENDHRW